jgi:hypothetical protein
MIRRLLCAGFLLACCTGFSACATVKAYQMENLADPIMAFQAEAQEHARELHWIEAREGSTGGAGGAGGGCACN